ADGDRGRDFSTVRLYVADQQSRPPTEAPPSVDAWDGAPTAPHRHAVINVVGPGVLETRADPNTVQPIGVSWTRVGSDMMIDTGTLALVDGGHEPDGRITVPPGEHTYTFVSDSPSSLRFRVTRAGSSMHVAPELTSAAMYMGGDDGSEAPLEADISGNARYGGVVRLRSRLLIPEARVLDERSYAVRYALLDARGNALDSGRYSVPVAPAPASYFADRLDVVPSASHAFDLALPARAVTLRVTSPDPVAFAFYASAPGERVVEVAASTTRSPVVRQECGSGPRDWFAFRPTAFDALTAAGRRLSLRYPCRHWREASSPSDSDQAPVLVARAVTPVVSHSKVVLLERVAAEDRASVGSDATFHEWPAGDAAIVTVADYVHPANPHPTPVSVVARGPAGRALPEALDVDDGAPESRAAVRRDGIWTLAHVEQGKRAFALRDGSGPLYVNRPPVDARPRTEWRRRTCYRLAGDGPLYVTMRKAAGRRATLNCVVYAREPRDRVVTVSAARAPDGAPPAPPVKYRLSEWETTDGFAPSTDAPYSHRVTLRPRIAADMPDGDYTLKLDLAAGAEVATRFVVMEDAAVIVGRRDPVVLNVVGPGTLLIDGEQAARLRVDMLAASGSRTSLSRTVDPEQLAAAPIPAGLVTVEVRSLQPATHVRMTLDGAAAVPAGRYALAPDREATPLRSDTLRQTYYRASAFDPARIPVEAGDVVRVGARSVAPGAVDIGAHTVRFGMADPASGVAGGTLDIAMSDARVVANINGVREEIAAEARGYIRVRATGFLRVWTDSGRSLLRFARLTADLPSTSYIAPPDEGARDIDALIDRVSAWETTPPLNAERLYHDGDVVSVVTPRLLARTAESNREAAPVWKWATLRPEATLARAIALEPVGLHARRTAYSIGSAFHAVSRGAAVELATHDLAGDVRVAYSRSSSRPATLTLSVNGVTHMSQPVAEAAGVVPVYGVPAGSPSVSIDIDPWDTDAALFVTHVAEVAASRAWMRRSYDVLPADGAATYHVRKPAADAVSVNVAGHVRPREGSPPTLDVTLRRTGGTAPDPIASLGRTATTRRYVFRPQGDPARETVFVPSSGSGEGLQPLGTFQIPLGVDLAPGEYAIDIRLAGADEGWLRLFVSDGTPDIIAPGGEMVVNLVGPGWLMADADNAVEVEQLTATGATRRKAVGGNGAARVRVERGPLTVTVRNPGAHAAALQLAVSDPASMDPGRGWPRPALAGGWAPISPRTVTQAYQRVAAGATANVSLPNDDGAPLTVRLTARAPADTSADGRAARIAYGFSDARGGELGGGTFTVAPGVDPQASGHERLSPTSVRYVRPPAGATHMSVSPERPVYIRAHARGDDTTATYSVPRAVDPSGGGVNTVAPTSKSDWTELAVDGGAGAVRFRVARPYVRRPTVGQMSPRSAVGVALTPEDTPTTLRVLEFSADASNAPASPTTYAAAPFNKDVLIDVVNHDAPDSDVPTTVRLLYGLGPQSEGTAPQIALLLDGRPLATHAPVTGIGRLLASGIAPGRHVLRIEAEEESLGTGRVAYIDQATVSVAHSRTLRLRTVHMPEPGRAMLVSVPKATEEPVTLNIVVTPIGSADRPVADVWVRAVVERPPVGGPARAHTALAREYHVAAESSSNIVMDGARYAPGVPRTCLLTLREDMPPGRHIVRVEILDRGTAAVRFFMMTEQAERDRVRTWRVSTDAGGD
ncbi:hypothetical protein HN766_08410, partial [Candidatus Poribacteria bacterium]|nr:hypothetical protein [Candidatus Poribacteria bacterium]